MKPKLIVLFLVILVLAGVSALSGCFGRSASALQLNPAPWADGEMTGYDVLKPDGSRLGTATWTWKRIQEGWEQSFELPLEGSADRQAVVMGADLFPLRSYWVSGGRQVTVTYGAEAVTFEREEQGGAHDSSAARPAG
jgi:hypothetical protein